MTEDRIHYICKRYNIENYEINDDMSIDVDGSKNVKIVNGTSEKLPLKFGKVNSELSCHSNKLTTLEGCPSYVGGGFYCSNNKLTTLEGCPKYVGGRFNCSDNPLTTLQHLPINFQYETFYCFNNNITNAGEYGKLFFGHISGVIATDHNLLNEFLNEHKNPPKKDLPRLLSELRKIEL